MSDVLDHRPVLFVLGWMVTGLALLMLVPVLASAAAGHGEWAPILAAAAFTLFVGVLLVILFNAPELRLSLRQSFLLTTGAYLVVTLFGALPLMVGSTRLSFTNAMFEAASGITTTGATVITGLDALPPGILLWRAQLQWLGGVGVVAIGMVLLPVLRIGGMQLFRSESSDRHDKVMPRATDVIRGIVLAYVLMSLVWAAGNMLLGLSVVDAIAHAMATLSTGGFSTRDASIGGFNDWRLEVWTTLGMIVGGLPIVRLLTLLQSGKGDIARDLQVRVFLGVAAVAAGVLTLWLIGQQIMPPVDALRRAAFNTISIITSTGYAAGDYAAWGPFAVTAFLMLMLIGGCTGSTAGGIKVFRYIVLAKTVFGQIQRQFQPHRIIALHYEGRTMDTDVTLSVMSFLFVYLGAVFFGALALGLLGLDLITAFTGAVSAIGNVGPGLGPVIGPAGTYTSLPDAAKWVLGFLMILGRLEVFTVLVLLNRQFWRR